MPVDPQDFIDAIINNAITLANTYTTATATSAGNIEDVVDGSYYHTWHPGSTPGVDAVEPAVPEVDDALILFDSQRDAMIALLSDKLADYFATYYPLENDAFDEAIAWLKDVIQNGGTGIPAAVEDAIWQRGRDRGITDARTAEAQILSSGAARGIPMIDGAVTGATRSVQLKRLEETGKLNTNISVKQAEIEIETIRFAVEQAINSRKMAMEAAGDYIRALTGAMGLIPGILDLKSSAKASLINATASLYRARLTRDEILHQTHVAARGQNERYFEARDQQHFTDLDTKIKASTNAAETYARTASAALSSLNGIISTSTSAFS